MTNTKRRHATNRAAAQDLQKKVCEFYASILNMTYGSSRDDAAEIKPRQSGQAGTDVVMSTAVRSKLIDIGIPDCVECKNQKIWNMQAAIQQAKSNTPTKSNWILVLKRRSAVKENRIDPVVVMDAGVFFDLIKRLYETRTETT